MDLIDRLEDLASRLTNQREHIQTEEATKNAFVMPFLAALGYDVFNPLEVIPEYTADVGTKRGEKVDYAIRQDEALIILVEAKQLGTKLDSNHASQLYRYFSVTEARFAVLTNGQVYKIYSDLDSPNVMDGAPFFEFDLGDFEPHHVEELKKFRKHSFSVDGILETAALLKYSNAVKQILEDELEDPSEEFVRFFASRIHEGRLTQAVLDQFKIIVKDARVQFINERINERLKSALTPGASPTLVHEDVVERDVPAHIEQEDNDGIVTTGEERQGFEIIRAILRESVDVSRVFIRDTQSYCGILLDNNNRKPICRLRFNAQSKKYVGFFRNKEEERVEISSLEEIFSHAERLKASVLEYDQGSTEES